MKYIKSLKQFKEIIDTGYELEFVLNGKHWLIEPDQGAAEFSPRRELICNDNNFIKKFENTHELLNYKINGFSLSENWKNMSEEFW